MARRLAFRAVTGVLMLACALSCFDRSTYQGGGRRDIGGSLVESDSGTSASGSANDPTEDPTNDPEADGGARG